MNHNTQLKDKVEDILGMITPCMESDPTILCEDCKKDIKQATEAIITLIDLDIIGVDDLFNKAHETDSCPGCNTFERNALRQEQRTNLRIKGVNP